MKLIYTILLFLASVLPVLSNNVTNDPTLSNDSIRTNLNLQLLFYPQEKIYIQTDKPYYISGETLFFRAFLLNAVSHEAVYWSRYIYLELINPVDSVIIRQQVRPEEDVFYGNFDLPEDLPQGNYRVRAYTRFMENRDKDYFYTQPVFIANPHILKIDTDIQYEQLKQDELGIDLCFRNKSTQRIIIPNEFAFRLNQEPEKTLKPDKEGRIKMKLKLKLGERNQSLWMSLKYDEGLFTQYIVLPRPKGEFEIRFYPEGGHLISDRQMAVAFEIHSSVIFEDTIPITP